MIHVERPTAPKVLDGEDSQGGKEIAAWELYYAGKRKKPSDFKAYADLSVRDTLVKIFHGKCAYCETMIRVGDIEHWRPKNAVECEDGSRTERGYWWLAADWNNLLYGCIACNQRRLQLTIGIEGWTTQGKGTKFPVKDEKKRAKKPGDEKDEEPLLINPCVEEPAQFFAFGVEGEKAGWPFPVDDQDGNPDPKGSKTIEVFNLIDPTLVRRRKETLVLINDRKKDIDDYLAALKKATLQVERDEILENLRRKIAELKRMLSDEKEDLMLKRQVLSPWLLERGIKNT